MNYVIYILIAFAILLIPSYLLYRRMRDGDELVEGGSYDEQLFGALHEDKKP